MIQSVVKLIPVLIFVCFAFVLKGYSCTCEPFSNCTAYAYSKGVYTGTLLRVEEDTESAFPKLHAYFAIDRTFKGAVEKTVELTFARSECLPNFRVGTRSNHPAIEHHPLKTRKPILSNFNVR